jgi:hypothetical protein
VPAARQEQAEAVTETAKQLIETAKSENPNKTTVQIGSDGRKQAGQIVAAVLKLGH